MKKFVPQIILLLISVIFFYKLVLFQQIPFPGDVLVSTYSPWKYESYLGYNPGSYPSKAQYFDVIRQIYPWKTFAISEMKEGRFPLWNPYNFSGTPFFANNQSAVLNPLNILFFILPKIPAWSIFIYLQPVIASIGMYIYLRTLKRSIHASLFGSVAFSYSLFMGVFVEYGNFGYSFVYLPILLYLIEILYKEYKSKLGILLPFLIGTTVFSGHFQISGSVVAFVTFYAIGRYFLDTKKNKKSLAIVFLYIVLGILISMVQVLPLLELLGNSARVALSTVVLKEHVLLQLHQLILFFAPDAYGNPATLNYLLKDTYPGNAIYVGIIPIFFLILSLFYIKKERLVAFFTVILTLLIILLSNNPVSVFLYSLNLPLISGSSPSNFIYLLTFSIASLSAFGMDFVLKAKRSYLVIVSITPILLFGLFFILNKIFGIEILSRQLILGGGILTISAISFILFAIIKKARLGYLLLFILVFDLFYYFIKFNPFVPQELVFPEPKILSEVQKYPNTRLYGYSAASIESNFQTGLKINSAEGYDPLYPKWYGKLIHSSNDGKILITFNETTRSQATLPNGYAEDDFMKDKTRLKLINETASGLILDRFESASKPTTFNKKNFRKMITVDGWSLYKNHQAKPRVFITADYDIYESDKEFESKFFNGNTLLLERDPGIRKATDGEFSTKILKEDSSSITIKTTATKDGVLVILDTYYPGWKAEVDGEVIEIIKANYAFRAIPLKQGDHIVELNYKPDSFNFGVILTIMGIVGSLVMLTFLKRIK